MKKKIILIFSTIVLVIGITLFLMLIIPTEDIPADYVFEMEYKIADFSNGIQEQKKSLNNVDLNDRDSIVLNLYKFSLPFLSLSIDLRKMDEPDEQDLQVFHNDFQNLVKAYNESSNNFVNAAKEQDIQLFKVSENELVLLIREYNDMHDRLEKLKEKYY